jgi:diguanylate cyclase (GGDEF)-like protein
MAVDRPDDDIFPELDAEYAVSMLESLRQLTVAINEKHGHQPSGSPENSDSKSSLPLFEATLVLAAATRLLEANQQLLSDLSCSKRELCEQQENFAFIQSQALTDELTGLLNRRALNQELPRLRAQSDQFDAPLCLLLIDLDHFQKINDRYGPLVGDEVLKVVASQLKQSIRGSDLLTRFGGEKYACVLPNMSLARAATFAERIRETIADFIYHMDDCDLRITVSVGYAAAQPDETTGQLIQLADRALYAAKQAGRNCCCFHDGRTCRSLPGQGFDIDSLMAAKRDVPGGTNDLFLLDSASIIAEY